MNHTRIAPTERTLLDKRLQREQEGCVRPLMVENDYGERIEIKYNADGVIRIRHSDIDPKAWGTLHEIAKGIRHPVMNEFIEANPVSTEVAANTGGYLVIRGRTFAITAREISLIHEAVKEAGGIVPNWSRSP